MKTSVDNAGGIGVDIISNEPIKLGSGKAVYIKLRYWHLLSPIGYDGKQVKYGQMIGLGGNTGASSGAHLHFGLKICNKDGSPLERGNGYFGAIDLAPYYIHKIYAGDSSIFLNEPAPPLTEDEKKVYISQVSLLKRLVFVLRELKSKL